MVEFAVLFVLLVAPSAVGMYFANCRRRQWRRFACSFHGCCYRQRDHHFSPSKFELRTWNHSLKVSCLYIQHVAWRGVAHGVIAAAVSIFILFFGLSHPLRPFRYIGNLITKIEYESTFISIGWIRRETKIIMRRRSVISGARCGAPRDRRRNKGSECGFEFGIAAPPRERKLRKRLLKFCHYRRSLYY